MPAKSSYRATVSLSFFLGSSIGFPAIADDLLTVIHEIHITTPGNFVLKTVKEMSSREFQVLASAACAAGGGDCTQEAAAARRGAEFLSSEWQSSGTYHYITGRLLSQIGEDWSGVFDSPRGFEACNAFLDYGNMSITGETTFNAVVSRSGERHGLSFYAVVPHRRTRHWVNATFVVTFAPEGKTADYNCVADQTIVWGCKGQSCSPLSRL